MTTPIEFEDIRVGDKIRGTLTHPSGDQSILIGVVKQKSRDGILQTHNFLFSPKDADRWEYELLERPLDQRQVELAKQFLIANFGYLPDSYNTDMHAQRFVRNGVVFPEV